MIETKKEVSKIYNPLLNLESSKNKYPLSQVHLKYYLPAPQAHIRSFGRDNNKFQQEIKKLITRKMFQPKVNKIALILHKEIEPRIIPLNMMSYRF